MKYDYAITNHRASAHSNQNPSQPAKTITLMIFDEPKYHNNNIIVITMRVALAPDRRGKLEHGLTCYVAVDGISTRLEAVFRHDLIMNWLCCGVLTTGPTVDMHGRTVWVSKSTCPERSEGPKPSGEELFGVLYCTALYELQ